MASNFGSFISINNNNPSMPPLLPTEIQKNVPRESESRLAHMVSFMD